MKRFLRSAPAALILGVMAVAASAPAHAGASVSIAAKCPATGPAIPICVAGAVVVHELNKLANGEDAFGPNGEVMKILIASGKIVDGNIKGAARERGEIDKVLRGVTGISVRDIRKHGVFGGPNSVFRKPFG